MCSKNKLPCILLVDNDPTYNFIHQSIIEDLGIDASVKVCTDTKQALDYLKGNSLFAEFIETPQPDLILLDIDMPNRDGWKFLEEYESLILREGKEAVIALISNAKRKEDIDQASQNKLVKKFFTKTGDGQYLKELIAESYHEF